MHMDVFFFRHGFDAQRSGRNAPIAGRYLFTVEGASLERDHDRLVPRRPSEHRVCVDGLEDEAPGSECRSERARGTAALVPLVLQRREARPRLRWPGRRDLRTFPGVVNPGDVVIFSDPRWVDGIAIDLVLCASERVELPTLDDAFALEDRFDAYWKECVEKGLAEPTIWEGFVRTPDFVLSLADSLPASRRPTPRGWPRFRFHPVVRWVAAPACLG
ncbi:MAG TPA: hypothetical protein VMK12_25925 [Anaeromyxobacteraceae bacterium]|nr:hypothetical protein [Anaeromyxobacteraceae bacterium]